MRIAGLDFLRGIAIILVLFRHGNLENNIVTNMGWLGVDLFFVLSGFLVSGLLFKEYLKNGNVRIKRFLVRRGFKIYPAFYFFMIIVLVFRYWQTGVPYPTKNILAEGFFVQNYLAGIWTHTWSLAVEEHFYFALAIITLIAVKTKLLTYTKTVISLLMSLLVASFLLRLYVSYPHRNDAVFAFTQTHLRSDGLIMGVLLSYLLHFTGFFKSIIINKKIPFAIAATLIIPGFYFTGGSFIMNTIGLTMVNLGFGIFTLLSIHTQWKDSIIDRIIKKPAGVIGFIGKNSYSVYLWHLTAMDIVIFLFNKNTGYQFLLFFLVSLFLGIGMSYVIEKPFLKWRDVITK